MSFTNRPKSVFYMPKREGPAVLTSKPFFRTQTVGLIGTSCPHQHTEPPNRLYSLITAASYVHFFHYDFLFILPRCQTAGETNMISGMISSLPMSISRVRIILENALNGA